MKADLHDLKMIYAALFGIAVILFVSQPTPRTAPLPDPNLHIYVLMGQSNMAGRGTIGKVSQPDAPPLRNTGRIQRLDSMNDWETATEPLHWDNPTAGVGPGLSFAVAMLNSSDKNVTIGLVPCAVGGTKLSRWERGGDMYAQALGRVKEAQKKGVLKGVIWHQGESDVENPANYAPRLRRMIADFRRDAGANVPVVVGELGAFVKGGDKVNAAIHNAARTAPLTRIASSQGLTDMNDGLHFNSASARELGKRYAAKMQELQAASTKISLHKSP